MDEFLERLAPIWTPHPGQAEFLLRPDKIKVLACGRRWGKTDACAVQVLAALHKPAPTKHLILAPTADQAQVLFDRLLALLDDFGSDEKVTIRRTPYPHLRRGPHTVMARSGHVPRSLRGHEASHIVIDEAAFLPEALITEVAMPMLATTGGELSLISTPFGRNHFWRFFDMGQRGENGVWSRRAPTRENPRVPPAFLEVQQQLISERAYRVEYMAEFADGAGRVFRSEAVESCLRPQFDAPAKGSISIGIDWARYSDYTAVAALAGDRQGCRLVHLEAFQESSWAATVRRAAGIVESFPGATVTCDATGVGDPVLEQLRAALPNRRIEGFNFTSASKPPLIDGLVWLIEQGSLEMMPDPGLLRELDHFEATQLASGRTALAAAGSGHDDRVMALALAAWALPIRYAALLKTGYQRQFSE